MLKRELKIAWSRRTQIIQYPIILFLLLIIFPLALGGNNQILTKFAGAALWISLIFSVLLGIDKIFADDFKDGIIENYLVHSNLIYKYIRAKLVSHWLITVIPQIIILPLFFILFNVSFSIFSQVFFSILLALANFILIGAFINALLLSLSSKGYLLVLLLVPFYLPILIFAVGVFSDFWLSSCALLAAMLCLLLVVCPFMVKISLRISVN